MSNRTTHILFISVMDRPTAVASPAWSLDVQDIHIQYVDVVPNTPSTPVKQTGNLGRRRLHMAELGSSSSMGGRLRLLQVGKCVDGRSRKITFRSE
jgi:hypothetical protein